MQTRNLRLPKFSPPRLAGVLPRPNLFAKLEAFTNSPVVWVKGPPGAGKSVLLAGYLDYRKASCLWYQVDGGDADASSFFEFLAQAAGLDVLTASIPSSRALDQNDVVSYARRFFRELFKRSFIGPALVFDNFERAPVLGPILREALEEVPSGASIMVASRTDPPAALARNIAHGQINLIDWEDLRLTEEESRKIAEANGLHDDATASNLHRDCEGWAAGLMIYLGAHRKGHSGASAGVAELTAAYFDTEVFQSLDQRTQSVLLHTAYLPELTPAMAIRLAGADSPGILEDLWRQSCFITRNEAAATFRCHPLFRTFLVGKLESGFAADSLSEIRQGAAHLLGECGQLGSAIELFARTDAVAEISNLVMKHADALLRSGRPEAIGTALSSLAANAIESDGWLLYCRGMSLLPKSPPDAYKDFALAYGMFGPDDRTGRLLAAVGAVEAILARVDSYLDLDKWIVALEPHMAQVGDLDNAADRARAWYAFLQAALLRRPGHPLIPVGVAWLRQSLKGGTFDTAETVAAGAVLLFYGCIAADEGIVRETVGASANAATCEDAPPVARWSWHYWYGLFWLWRLEYALAMECWEKCTQISTQYGLGALEWLVHGNLVMVDLAEDRLDQAEWRLGKLRHAGNEGHMNAYALYWMGETFLRLYRRRDDLPEAVKAMVESSRATGFFNLEMLCLSDAAAVHLLRDEDEAAEALIDEVAARVANTVVRQCDGQIAALRAGLQYRGGQVELAHRTFAQALDLVASGGTCGCMLWVRAGLSTLFGEAIRLSRYAPLVRDLVRQYQVPPPARAGSEWPWPIRIHSLGRFSIEIDGAPMPVGRKAQQKVLDLLKALIAEGARDVDGNLVADWLWPDVDGDAAQSNLRGTVKRLRELLGHPESVRLFDGKISLNERLCWLDLWVFREWCGDLIQGGAGVRQRADPTHDLLSLYRGPLLNGEDAPWLQPARRRERMRIGRVLAELSGSDESTANRLRENALLVDPGLAAV